jgi:phosphoadenosine phosphosulfate reductase
VQITMLELASLNSDLLQRAQREPELLRAINAKLAALPAEARVQFALAQLPGTHALTSSFGAQAAVCLHLLTRQAPNLPIILIDTGYLFPETYQFVEKLRHQLSLNLIVYRAQQSPASMEAQHGKLWEKGVQGIEQYNQLRKVEPMQRALQELCVQTWIAGLRRGQASSRSSIEFLEFKNLRWKFHPIADWSDRDIWHYLKQHQLDYHPLWQHNYVSIGDTHTSRAQASEQSPESTRFFGLKRECGLHEHWGVGF